MSPLRSHAICHAYITHILLFHHFFADFQPLVIKISVTCLHWSKYSNNSLTPLNDAILSNFHQSWRNKESTTFLDITDNQLRCSTLTSAVEQLADRCRRQDFALPQYVRQVATDRHDKSQNKMRQSSQSTCLYATTRLVEASSEWN